MSNDEYGEPINLAAAEQAGTWPYDQQGVKPPTDPDSLHVPDPSLVAAFEAEDVVSDDAVGPSWQHFTEWRGPTPDEAARMAAVAQRHTAAELRRLADIVPVGPARTILLNEADRIEGTQR